MCKSFLLCFLDRNGQILEMSLRWRKPDWNEHLSNWGSVQKWLLLTPSLPFFNASTATFSNRDSKSRKSVLITYTQLRAFHGDQQEESDEWARDQCNCWGWTLLLHLCLADSISGRVLLWGRIKPRNDSGAFIELLYCGIYKAFWLACMFYLR